MAVSKKKALSKSTAKPKTPKKKSSTKNKVVKKQVKSKYLGENYIDIDEFDKKYNSHIPLEKSNTDSELSEALTAVCPQGKQSKVTRDNPHTSPPVNTSNYITELHVTLSTQNLKLTWLDGTVENWFCSPNPSLTPKGNDLVGNKCGPLHTNFKRDGMAWFTALQSHGMVYGFHNSQRVGIGVVSHGCIRVSCDHAKTINQNSWSGKTKIKIVR
jgi:hypothetical protein